MATSRKLLTGDFAFPFLNYGFAATLGGAYAVIGYILSLVPRIDLAVILFAILAAGFIGYSGYQESRSGKLRVVALSLLHSAIHFLAVLILTCGFIALDSHLWSLKTAGPWWSWLLEFSIPMIFGGGLLAGFIFGANLFFTCRFADLSHNDASVPCD